MENIVLLWENNGKYSVSMGKQWKIWCFYGKTQSDNDEKMEHLSDLGELLWFMNDFVWTIRGVLC